MIKNENGGETFDDFSIKRDLLLRKFGGRKLLMQIVNNRPDNHIQIRMLEIVTEGGLSTFKCSCLFGSDGSVKDVSLGDIFSSPFFDVGICGHRSLLRFRVRNLEYRGIVSRESLFEVDFAEIGLGVIV